MKINSSFSLDCADLPTRNVQGCLQQFLPAETGSGCTRIIELDSEMSFLDTCYAPNRNLQILSKVAHQQPRLVVTFSLQGRSRFIGQKGNEIYFTEAYTSITRFIASIGAREYQANTGNCQCSCRLDG